MLGIFFFARTYEVQGICHSECLIYCRKRHGHDVNYRCSHYGRINKLRSVDTCIPLEIKNCMNVLMLAIYRIDSDIYLLPVYSVVPKLSPLIALHKQLCHLDEGSNRFPKIV